MKMLYYDTIDISEGIDVKKTSTSKQCDVVTIGIFLKIVLSFSQMSAIDVTIY